MCCSIPQEKREGEYINLELATEEREKGNTAFKEQRYPEVRSADAWPPGPAVISCHQMSAWLMSDVPGSFVPPSICAAIAHIWAQALTCDNTLAAHSAFDVPGSGHRWLAVDGKNAVSSGHELSQTRTLDYVALRPLQMHHMLVVVHNVLVTKVKKKGLCIT